MKKSFKTFFVIFAVFVGFSLVGCSHTEKQEEPVQESKVEPSKEIETPNLGMTFQEFKEKYNSTVAQYNLPKLLLKDEFNTSEKNDVKEFVFLLGDMVFVGVEVDINNNMIRKVTVSSDKKAYKVKENLLFQLMIYDSTMAVFSPQLTGEERKSVIREFTTHLKRYLIVKNDIKYSSQIYNDILFLSVTPKDAK